VREASKSYRRRSEDERGAISAELAARRRRCGRQPPGCRRPPRLEWKADLEGEGSFRRRAEEGGAVGWPLR
jgi:hypothetical protein